MCILTKKTVMSYEHWTYKHLNAIFSLIGYYWSSRFLHVTYREITDKNAFWLTLVWYIHLLCFVHWLLSVMKHRWSDWHKKCQDSQYRLSCDRQQLTSKIFSGFHECLGWLCIRKILNIYRLLTNVKEKEDSVDKK